jgi:rRNA maturation protein Nop10
MDAKLRAELLSIGIDVTGQKEHYVLAESCPGCGMVPLYSGHTCGDKWVREACPACGKVLLVIQHLQSSRTEPICDCGSIGCPFCRQCCEWLSNNVQGRLYQWPRQPEKQRGNE